MSFHYKIFYIIQSNTTKGYKMTTEQIFDKGYQRGLKHALMILEGRMRTSDDLQKAVEDIEKLKKELEVK